MLPPPPQLRRIVTLGALIGCLVAVAPARRAGAAGCHVPDRPVFGLSIAGDRPAIPTIGDRADDGTEAIRVDRHCPSDDPEPPPSRTPLPGDQPLATAGRLPILGGPGSRLGLDDDGLRPRLNPSRIDRPPQRS